MCPEVFESTLTITLTSLLQDATNSTINICDSSIVRKKMLATWGQSLHVGCFLMVPPVLTLQKVTWYHFSKEKGRNKIVFRHSKYIETAQNGLIILAIKETDAGLYDCLIGPSLLCSYNITVDSGRCTPPDKTKDYREVYSEWCHEFERYKYSMNIWQQKQNKCVKYYNQTDNSLSNNVHQTL